MPTYIYRFLDSDATIEVQQAFTDAALTEAIDPADGRMHPVKKVFTPVGITFKGDGFYKTDNRGKSAKAGAGAPAATASSESASASTSAALASPSSDGSSSSSNSSGSSGSSTPATPSGNSHGDHSH